jgi:hypothetical protein
MKMRTGVTTNQRQKKMKQVINRKLYDTETAEEIVSASANCAVNDFAHWSETLYRTSKGAWFIHGHGGPMSPYRESCGNNGWSGSSRITPLSPEEAAEWCERNDLVDTLQTHFNHLIEEA